MQPGGYLYHRIAKLRICNAEVVTRIARIERDEIDALPPELINYPRIDDLRFAVGIVQVTVRHRRESWPALARVGPP